MNKEKTFANMNSIEQNKLAEDICMTQPLGKRGLNEYMGEEYANDVILNRTARQIKRDIAWFQKMIIDGQLHKSYDQSFKRLSSYLQSGRETNE